MTLESTTQQYIIKKRSKNTLCNQAPKFIYFRVWDPPKPELRAEIASKGFLKGGCRGAKAKMLTKAHHKVMTYNLHPKGTPKSIQDPRCDQTKPEEVSRRRPKTHMAPKRPTKPEKY